MALLMAAIAGSVYGALRSNLYRDLWRTLSDDLEHVQKQVAQSPLDLNWDGLSALVFGQFEYVQSYLNASADQEIWQRSTYSRTQSLRDYGLDTGISLAQGGNDLLQREGRFQGEGTVTLGDRKVQLAVRAVYLPATTINPNLGIKGFLLYVARDLSQINEPLDSLRNILWVVTITGLLAAGVGAYYLAGRALEPIRAVRDVASEITSKNLSNRVPEQGTRDEVDDLARTLNGMLDRLEDSFDAQRRFTADASHELRTPVTAITGHASYLLRRTNLTAEQRESLEAITKLGDRLKRLIGDLLDLARADVSPQIEPTETSLMDLAEDVHLEVAAIAGKTEILIEGKRELLVRADPNRVRQVILNLVQNAIKAGSKHVWVRVKLEEPSKPEAQQQVLLSVEDDGPGIPEDHLPKLFDRFYRVDTARDRALGGSGLGLSIVKWITEAHGGTVGVSSQVNVGTRFDVRLPLLRIAPERVTHVSTIEDIA